MVRLSEEAFGRGPTDVRATLAGADGVVVVLKEGFMAAERTLLGSGEINRRRTSRLMVQEARQERARWAVEAALERQTLAHIMEIGPRRGVAGHVFTLEPATVADGDQRAAAHGWEGR